MTAEDAWMLLAAVVLGSLIVGSYIQELRRHSRKAPPPRKTTVLAAAAVPSIPPAWRRAVFPRCPNCGAPGGEAQHRGCRKNGADLYIDIGTGYNHCIACGHVSGIEGWRSFCNRCGAVWEGGEIWQGMAAEVGRMGDIAWLKAAGVRRGTPEITFLGWWWCCGCRRRFEDEFLRRGSRRGGICGACAAEPGKD